MKYITRKIERLLTEYLELFPVVGLTGPRQSGKSTMLKEVLKTEFSYVTFDDPLMIDFFQNDPHGFMAQYGNKVIFDEIQKMPEIFPYIKMAVDNDRQNYGKFIVTGSSQFSMIKQITESLAGRIGLLSLLPFQYSEIPEKNKKAQLISGGYPEIVMRDYKGSPQWFSSYVMTYIERDVRNLFNIGKTRDFNRFLSLLAARCAQEMNMSVYSRELGVDVKTIQNWISVLEASYIIFLLPGYYRNLGKRIVKRSKIYFYDTGLLCYLTGIRDQESLNKGPLRGSIFENYFVSEMRKTDLHTSSNSEFYYFRTNSGLEVDLIKEDKEENVEYFEIKNNSTPKYKMIENLKKVIELDTAKGNQKGVLIYTGKDDGSFSKSIKYYNYQSYLSQLL